jgi:hypothetical protein
MIISVSCKKNNLSLAGVIRTLEELSQLDSNQIANTLAPTGALIWH